jgi:hypothetical protein
VSPYAVSVQTTEVRCRLSAEGGGALGTEKGGPDTRLWL